MKDYRQQFEQLNATVDENNKEVAFLRQQLGEAQKHYFALRVSNEALDEEVTQAKAQRDLQLGLNEERRLNQAKINVEDAARKTNALEQEVQNIVDRWQGKIAVV